MSSNVIGGRNDFSPQGIAVDSSGNVYVSDFNNSRILKFDSNGNYLMQWGSRGNRINEFNGPMDIAIDSSGNVYVVDANNNRIQKFSGKGEYLTQWAFSLILSGQFQYPSGIAVDSLGNVYVTNNGFNSIVRLYSNGNFTQFGSQGTGKGQLNYPLGLAVDSSGNVYVADSGNGRIQKFAIDDNATIEPVASFSYTVCFNKAPFIVYFYDKSTGTPTYWSWEFGDGDTSNQRNPIHVYNETGKYQVTLTVSNEAGRNIYTQAFTIPMSTKDGETIHTAQVQTPTVGQSQNTSMSTDKGTQTSTTEKTPWYQSPLFVAIVGGLFLIASYEYQRLRERK